MKLDWYTLICCDLFVYTDHTYAISELHQHLESSFSSVDQLFWLLLEVKHVGFYVLKLVDSKYNQLTVINKVFYYLISISVIDYFISFVLITQIQ